MFENRGKKASNIRSELIFLSSFIQFAFKPIKRYAYITSRFNAEKTEAMIQAFAKRERERELGFGETEEENKVRTKIGNPKSQWVL